MVKWGMSVKICSKCERELAVACFHRDKTKFDGLFPSCKECRRGVSASYYLENKEKICRSVGCRRVVVSEARRIEREAYELEHADEIEALKLGKAEARREKNRVRERERYWADPEKIKARNREYRRKNPEKQAARSLVTSAIRSGELIQEPCEVCSEEKVEAHHDDYSKPLVVRWLCSVCHGLVHRHTKIPHSEGGNSPSGVR